MKHPILYHHPDHSLTKARDDYGVWYIPHNVLIDRTGRRVGVFIGDRYWMAKDKQELIKFLISEDSPSTVAAEQK